MENMQAKATLQLLNIQDPAQEENQDIFQLIIPKIKQKSASKLTTRTLTSHSSYRDQIKYQKQDNKENLKKILKKLLQKQCQTPKSIMKRVKTTGCSQSSKMFQNPHKVLRFNQNQQSQINYELRKRQALSIQRQNTSSSQKTLITSQKQGNLFSIFELQNQQIRRIIKKRISQKISGRVQKVKVPSTTNQRIQKIKSLLSEKNVFNIKNIKNNDDDNGLINLRSNKKSNSKKIFTNTILNEKILLSIGKDKQNLKGFSASSTPVNHLNSSPNIFGNRKLKNILF